MNKPKTSPSIDMTGKICLITVANTGIGKTTAIGVAKTGAQVVLVCRDRARGEAAQAEVKGQSDNANVDLLLTDLSAMQAVRDLADTVNKRYARLEVLINNAGVFDRTRKVTADGYERTFAVNYLAPFLLTHLLLDKLKASEPARIINVSSAAHTSGRIKLDDLNRERDYSGWQAYCQSKLALNLFTFELARRLEGGGVTANCVHPGTVATDLFRGVPPPIRGLIKLFMKSPVQGAETPIWLATSPEVENVNGEYFANRKPAQASAASHDREKAERLWAISEEMTGLKPQARATAG
jgi:NAD(P)-dependent dehydrogenase (short-subunit alcohol dehydrogenase family)